MSLLRHAKQKYWRWISLLLIAVFLTATTVFAAETAAEEAEPSVRNLAPGQIPLPLPRRLPRRKDYAKRQEYRMPEFDPAWNLSREVYEKASLAYDYWSRDTEVNRFMTVVDLGKKSTERRFYVFDLEAGRVDELLTTHGKNSDPQNDGVANQFSNEEESLQSSLGTYLTLNPYTGSHGYSLRLRGLEDSNFRAEERAVVIHSATYVSELVGAAGRSWGCFVLDPIIVRATIDRLKGGSLMYVGTSAAIVEKKIEKKKPETAKPKTPSSEPVVGPDEDPEASDPAPPVSPAR